MVDDPALDRLLADAYEPADGRDVEAALGLRISPAAVDRSWLAVAGAVAVLLAVLLALSLLTRPAVSVPALVGAVTACQFAGVGLLGLKNASTGPSAVRRDGRQPQGR